MCKCHRGKTIKDEDVVSGVLCMLSIGNNSLGYVSENIRLKITIFRNEHNYSNGKGLQNIPCLSWGGSDFCSTSHP